MGIWTKIRMKNILTLFSFRICPNYVFEILQFIWESQVNKTGLNFFSEGTLIEQKWEILIENWAHIMIPFYGW